MMLDFDQVKEILLFCKQNRIHHIELGSLKADLVPDEDPQPENTSPQKNSYPDWVDPQ